jgi:hypothetical protein
MPLLAEHCKAKSRASFTINIPASKKTPTMENKVTTPVMKGLIISLILIVFAVVVTIFKLETNKALGIVPIVILLGGIIWANINFAQQMDGNVTFGKAFGHGFKASALVAGIMGLWVAFSLTVLFPESLDRAMEMQRTAMLEQGMGESEVDKALSIGKKMAAPMGAIVSVIMYLIVGAIGSLIGAAVAKKNPTPTPFQ